MDRFRHAVVAVVAVPAFEHTLRLTEREGYVRLFADLRVPMARPLREARPRDVMPGYVAQLRVACGADLGSAAGTGQLPDPLSEREREVLARVAAELMNREIADMLFISAESVTKLTGNINGKLGVRGRTEAAARARRLDLLD